MSDQLFDGRRIRLLTRVDGSTRGRLAVETDRRLQNGDVVRAPNKIRLDHVESLETIRVDNKPEHAKPRGQERRLSHALRCAVACPARRPTPRRWADEAAHASVWNS